MIKDKLNSFTTKLILIFLYMQPILDVIAAYMVNNNINNLITSVIRLGFMFYMLFYLLFSDYENKKKIVLYIGLIFVYIFIHMLFMFIYKDSSVLFFELRNILSTFYFVILLISFNVVYKTNDFDKKHFLFVLIIYLLLTFVPTLFGISYESYGGVSKVGKTGLFYSANTLGTIIILLFSFVLPILFKKNIIYKIIFLSIFVFVIMTLGTKTPVIGLALIIFVYFLYYIFKLFKERKTKIIILVLSMFVLVTLTSVLIIPKTNFYENIKIHLDFLEKQENMNSYQYIDHFIFSSRLKKMGETRDYYKSRSLYEKFFGIGYIEDKKMNLEKYKTIEIDYFDIFYREGIIGFVIYFIPLIYILIQSVNYIKVRINVNVFTSWLLILLIALFQGHVFVTPQVSLFVSLIVSLSSMNFNKKEV